MAKAQTDPDIGSGVPWRRWLRIAALVMVGMVVLASVVVLALLYSSRAQTTAIRALAWYGHKRTGFTLTVGQVWMDFSGHTIELKGVQIADLQGRRMIEAPDVSVTYEPDSVFHKGMCLQRAWVRGGAVRMVSNQEQDYTNLILFADTLRSWLQSSNGPGDTLHPSPPPTFRIGEAHVRGLQFILSNESRDTLPTGLDYNHMDWRSLSTDVAGFRARSDTVEAQLLALSTYDARTRWPVRRLRTHLRYTRNLIRFSDMDVEAGYSRLAGDVLLQYQRPANLGNFIDSVLTKARLQDSRLDARDLALFADKALTPYKGVVLHVDGLSVSGFVRDFEANEMRIRFGHGTVLEGSLAMAGLPEAKPLTILANLRSPAIIPADLYPYVPKAAHPYLARLGTVRLISSFAGTPEAFDIKADVKGQQGQAALDGKVALGSTLTAADYQGKFLAKDFRLGRVLGFPLVGRITGDGQVKGHGLVWEQSQIEARVRIRKLEVLAIPIKNWRIEATLDRHKIMQALTGIKLGGAKKEGG